MSKIKTLLSIISVFVFYLFYLNNIVYAGDAGITIDPLNPVKGQKTTLSVDGGTSGTDGGDISLRFPNPLGGDTTTVIDVVRNIINGIFGLLGAIAVVMIVYGGIIYMTGGSSKDGVEKGKKIITSAVVGLVIVLLSLAIIDLLFVLLGGR